MFTEIERQIDERSIEAGTGVQANFSDIANEDVWGLLPSEYQAAAESGCGEQVGRILTGVSLVGIFCGEIKSYSGPGRNVDWFDGHRPAVAIAEFDI
jgi:hypothetical protein